MRIIDSEISFKGKVFNVRRDTVEDDGKRRVIEVVEHALSYAIIARPKADEIVLVRQYRHAAGQPLWEIPAGMSDPNEDPAAGALRELREETGFRGGRIQRLFTLFPTPGYCEERLAFFLVDDLAAGETAFDEDEAIETSCLAISEALARLDRGEISDAKTALALLWLDRTQRQ